MLFNSLDFAFFLPIIFVLYWFVVNKNLKLQNLIVVVASYIFYGWWDWRFLSLIFFSTVIDYFVGYRLKTEVKTFNRKLLLWISILINLGFLGFFKYYNFFLENFISAFTLFGLELNANTLNIILPVGISFYTFQTMSYTIDVYKKKLEPTDDFIAFAAFVSFFPQLVAGPIERAKSLLPQFYDKRKFNYADAVDGSRQVLWGFFKKIVIADNCAIFANEVFNNSTDLNGSTLLLGAIFFTFQIYGDFSGYSDIAIGTSKLFGFNLMQNFAFPYFSRDIAEFWRRWHISLSTWFRDYLYIPLGGSRGNRFMKVRNTFIIFIVSGFWHGANWTFIIWGTLNAIYFLPLLLTDNNRINIGIIAKGRIFPSIIEIALMAKTFLLTVLAWVFFRAENVTHALNYLFEIFSSSIFSPINLSNSKVAILTITLIIVFIIAEWMGREGKYALEKIGKINYTPLRWLVYISISIAIIMFGNFNKTEFIYFAF